jgi:hypothetical protein
MEQKNPGPWLAPLARPTHSQRSRVEPVAAVFESRAPIFLNTEHLVARATDLRPHRNSSGPLYFVA